MPPPLADPDAATSPCPSPKCPGCGCRLHRTLDARPCTVRDPDAGARYPSLRRRRECTHCSRRFTTHDASPVASPR